MIRSPISVLSLALFLTTMDFAWSTAILEMSPVDIARHHAGRAAAGWVMANCEGTEQRADEVTSEVIKIGGAPYDAVC